MNDIVEYISVIKYGLGALMGIIIAGLGGWDMPLEALIIAIIIDFITGILRSIYQHQLSSDISGKGIIKKVAYLAIVALSVMLGHYLGTPILRDAVIGAFVISESLSVIENAAAMDIIVPEALKDILAQSKPEKFK